MITNISISNDAPAIQYYKYCHSFLLAALSQAKILLINEESCAWSDCTVVKFLFSHGVELFYKSALSSRKVEFNSSHNIVILEQTFNSEFNKDNISIGNPFSIVFLGEFKNHDKLRIIKKHDKPSVLYRYPFKDAIGSQLWDGIHGCEPKKLVERIENYILEIERVALLIGLLEKTKLEIS